MFAVYGISGQIFQGTLENLGRMPPVARRSPATRSRRIGDQDIAPTLQAVFQETATPGEHAVKAYQAMLPDDLERGPLYHASQIMQREIITVAASDDVTHAWNVLVEHRIHQAPVLGETGNLVGLVGERELLTVLNVEAGRLVDVMARKVSDVMSTPVITALPLTDIRRIARVMLEHDAEAVPVVTEDGRLVGFVSHTDILKAVVTDPPLSIWR